MFVKLITILHSRLPPGFLPSSLPPIDDFDSREESDGGRLIGEGGFGEVFLGLTSNRQRVAVKCLKDNTEDTVKQFLAEIKVKHTMMYRERKLAVCFLFDGRCFFFLLCLLFYLFIQCSRKE